MRIRSESVEKLNIHHHVNQVKGSSIGFYLPDGLAVGEEIAPLKGASVGGAAVMGIAGIPRAGAAGIVGKAAGKTS